MHDLAKENIKIISQTISRADAIKLFTDLGEPYKVKLIEAIPER